MTTLTGQVLKSYVLQRFPSFSSSFSHCPVWLFNTKSHLWAQDCGQLRCTKDIQQFAVWRTVLWMASGHWNSPLWEILQTSSYHVLCFHCLDLQTLRNRNDIPTGERQTLWCFLLSSKRNLLSVCCSLWTLWLTQSHEVSQVLLMHCRHGHILTPADEKEDPLSKLISWISHDNGRMKVTPFNKHPEKVCHHKVVVYGCNQTTPRLEKEKTWLIVTWKQKERITFLGMRLVVNTSLPHCSHGYCGRSAEAKTT